MDTSAVLRTMQDVAAEVITPRYRSLSQEQVHLKGPGDFVTDADREAEELLTARISQAHPGAVVVGEERYAADPAALDTIHGCVDAYVIDPIDGTRNFVEGRPDFGVMVAHLQRGVTVRSWIWQPIHERSWVAELGAGVRCNGEAVTRPPRDRPIVGVTSTPADEGVHGDLTLAASKWSCAIDYPTVVSGEWDVCLYRSSHPWDHLPGALMLSEVGGAVRYRDGSRYRGVSRRSGVVALGDAQDWDRIKHLTALFGPADD